MGAMRNRQYDCRYGRAVEATLDVIGGRWKGVILFHLIAGTKRFNELHRLIEGCTQCRTPRNKFWKHTLGRKREFYLLARLRNLTCRLALPVALLLGTRTRLGQLGMSAGHILAHS